MAAGDSIPSNIGNRIIQVLTIAFAIALAAWWSTMLSKNDNPQPQPTQTPTVTLTTGAAQ